MIWRSLEATPRQRRHASRMFTATMGGMAIGTSALYGFTEGIAALLGCLTPFAGLADIVSGEGGARLGLFFGYVLVVAVVIQLMLQPIFCVYLDRGRKSTQRRPAPLTHTRRQSHCHGVRHHCRPCTHVDAHHAFTQRSCF